MPDTPLPIGNLPVAPSINPNAAFALQQDVGSGQETFQAPFSMLQSNNGSTRVSTNYTSMGERWIFVTDVTTAPVPRTVTLSTNDFNARAVITIKDETNTAASNNIIIVSQGGEIINNGPTSINITSNGGSVTLVSDGTVWETIRPDDSGGTTLEIILEDTSMGPVTSTLPAASAVPFRAFDVKDRSGNAGTNNITVDVSGGGNIDGDPTVLITADYGIGRFYSDGTQWFTR